MLLVTGLVAVASSEDVPAGTARRPGDRMLDLLFSFGVVALGLAFVAGAILYGLGWHLRLRKGDDGNAPSPLRGLAVLGFVALLLGVIAFRRRDQIRLPASDVAQPDVTIRPGADVQPAADSYTAHFATVPVLIVLGALAAALVAVALTRRARRRADGPRVRERAPSLDEVLADTVEDLRSEPDPRRAVIAAYARLERALAAAGHPRIQSDAPGEYLGRVLRDADVAPAAVARLTTLFATAKFSQHDVGEEMRSEAIDALEQVREDLRAAELAREALVPA